MDHNLKKVWTTPELTQYGAVEDLTQQDVKSKKLGASDDFGISGICNP